MSGSDAGMEYLERLAVTSNNPTLLRAVEDVRTEMLRREARGMSGEANSYVADLRAENARLREVVRRVEGLAAYWIRDAQSRGVADDLHFAGSIVAAALNAPTPAEPSTDTGPTPAGAHSGSQGAGNGV